MTFPYLCKYEVNQIILVLHILYSFAVCSVDREADAAVRGETSARREGDEGPRGASVGGTQKHETSKTEAAEIQATNRYLSTGISQEFPEEGNMRWRTFMLKSVISKIFLCIHLGYKGGFTRRY